MSGADGILRRFAVVTDSTADISVDTAAEHRIAVVPLSVSFGDEVFVDGHMGQAEFFARMNASSELPRTSQPAVGAFVEAYRRALDSAEHVISIHISNRLSGTVDAARQAAETFAGRVTVFDSLNLSWGLAWQVMEAARAAADGLGVDAAMSRLEAARGRAKLIVGLDSLDNLAKGGRIGRVGALLGSLLNLKVTFTVDADGAFAPLARVRGEKAALAQTLEWVGQQMGAASSARFAVGHALSEARARWLGDEIAKRWGVTEMVMYETGSVIATHTGTGWGVAVFPDA